MQWFFSAKALTRALLPLVAAYSALAGVPVVNASEDLVRLGIASQNMVPNEPGLDSRPLLQAAVAYANRNGTQLLTVDTGSYYFLTPQMFDRYLEIDSLNGMTIDFAGSDLYFENRELIGLIFSNCQGATLQNFSMDFMNLPFTQVQLTGVSANQLTLSYQTIGNWPDPTEFNTVANPYGTAEELLALVFRNGSLAPGTNLLPLSGPLKAGTLQVQQQDSPWTQPSVLATYQPGDIAVVLARGGEAPLYISGGSGNTLRNINVYSSAAIAIHLDTTANTTVYAVHVEPRPGTDRLISSNSDGIHMSFAQANNIVQFCYVSHTVDDGIAINSPFLAFVNQQKGSRQLSVERNFDAVFPNGLSVLFVNANTGTLLSGADIVSQNPAFSDPPPNAGPVSLTFDQNLPTLANGYGMIYADPGSRGAGSTIEWNLVEDVLSARGIYLGGVSGVTVRQNTVRRSDCGGIVAHQDLASYPVGPAENLLIEGNTVDTAIGAPAVGTGTVAALASIFVLTTDPNFNFISSEPNTNITVQSNYVINSGRAGIWISNASGAAVQDNLIEGVNLHPEQAFYGVDSQLIPQLTQNFKLPVVVQSSSGVTITGNVEP